jgi:hypothetical protein
VRAGLAGLLQRHLHVPAIDPPAEIGEASQRFDSGNSPFS